MADEEAVKRVVVAHPERYGRLDLQSENQSRRT
jgi:hypothetical protein